MSSSSSTKVCFNSNCKETSDNWRRGWRRRTGDYAHLCDRCASAYEDGKFCETFHLNASGWRCCESCGKQIHCGCIVSFHMFVLLDAGGIECLTCAKKSYILTPNPAWPPPSHFLPSQPERMKDLSVKSWSAIAGSGPVPWRQAPSLFNSSDIQSNAHLRMPFEVNVSGGLDRHHICDRLSHTSPDMKQEHSCERFVIGKMRLGPSQTLQNGPAGPSMKDHGYPLNNLKTVFPQNDSSSPNLNFTTEPSSKTGTDEVFLSAILSQPPAVPNPVGKASRSGMDSFGEAQIRNGKTQGDGRGRNHLLPRYHPQITDEELQQISSDSKSVITPLFEKMLSASDAGRIGRLVLPKKCAEAYFPPITQPEGLPLKVLDVKGKEWVFQFRFWPNNNSRMYVLEGITPCIQSMKLQAGDVVMFSRLEPEGKLIMGGRKASVIPSSDQVYHSSVSVRQGDEVTIVGTDSAQGDSSARNNPGDAISVDGHVKEKILADKPIMNGKRKNNNFGAKSKRLRIENEDILELKITWKEAQALMRAPAKIVPSCFIVEGCEFEEFEETAPVIGRPTILGTHNCGEKVQWVQCEDCFKWRKVPADALLPSRWVCSDNVWDINRSLCSGAEELSKEQLEHMLPTMNKDCCMTEEEADVFVAVEGLDRLANITIQGEGEGEGVEHRTKHPRHKAGCTCIVCLQPPSGKGSKHKQSCECVVCSSLKRRFRTLMERREKKQLEKEAESCSSHKDVDGNQEVVRKWGYLDQINGIKSSTSALKGKIDLNIQPEREGEEDLSDFGPMRRSADRFLRQQNSVVIGNLDSNLITCMSLDAAHHKTG